MQSLRDILRSSLHTSLGALTPLDRLAAAWPVVAGHAIAQRSTIVRLDRARAVAEVRDPAWLPELRANTPRLLADLAKVSGVSLTDILFVVSAASETPGPAKAHLTDEQHGTEHKSRPARPGSGRSTPG